MVMFNAKQYRQNLAENDNYLGKSDFALDSLEWRSAKIGHIGNITDYRFNVTPMGNYINLDYGSLDKAKFQFHLTAPVTFPFHEDYNRAFQQLRGLQSSVAVTPRQNNMLFKDAGGQSIRMTKSVFNKRKTQVRDSSPPSKKRKIENEKKEDDMEEMDEDTKNWKVPSHMWDDLNLMKPNYQAISLPIFENGQFIEPNQVQQQLENTLVEVIFSINHAFIKKDYDTHDSFQAEIKQVIILKKTISQANNPCTGPASFGKRRWDGDKKMASGDLTEGSSGNKAKEPAQSSSNTKGKEPIRPNTSNGGPSGS
ncbi:hypothetical protein OG21DRAFT_1527073 [Imleria badia]|nr:hypothetical protein OG21DRAFT_1527073 [Imleria badia]